LASRSTQ